MKKLKFGRTLLTMVAMLIPLLALTLAGCSGGSDATATTPATVAKSTLAGDITFPDDAALGKVTVKSVGLATGTVLIDVFTLDNAKVKSGVASTWNDTTKSYSYTVSDLTPGVDYLIRAIKTKSDGSTLTLKKLVEKANVAEGSNTGLAVNTNTTTIVTVVEKKLFDTDNNMKVILGDDAAKLPSSLTDAAALSAKIKAAIGSVKDFETQLGSITNNKGEIVEANITAAEIATRAILADLATIFSQVKAAVQASVPTHELIVEQKADAITAAGVKITAPIAVYSANASVTSVQIKEIKTITTDSIKNYTPVPAVIINVDFLAAIGSYEVAAPNKGTLNVDANGNVTITSGGTVIGNGKLTATTTSTIFTFAATFTTDSDTLQGTLNTVTGQFSGTKNGSGSWSATKSTNTASNVFTPAMVTGKTFSYSFSSNASITETGSITYKADNILTKTNSTGTLSGTWSINSSGQLAVTLPNEIDTVTLTSSTPTSFTAVVEWRNPNDNRTGSGTLTGSLASDLKFTTDLVSGRSFSFANSDGNTGTVFLKADNTFTGTSSSDTTTRNGTWSINSSGQLVIKGSTETDTMTLTSRSTNIFVVSSVETNSTEPGVVRNVTITLSALTGQTGGGSVVL